MRINAHVNSLGENTIYGPLTIWDEGPTGVADLPMGLGIKFIGPNEGTVYKFFNTELFNFKKNESVTTLFKWDQILELQFEPFKKFAMGYITEEADNGYTWSNNDLKRLHTPAEPLSLRRSPSWGTGEDSIIDIFLDQWDDNHGFTNAVELRPFGFKLKKSLPFPIVSSAWANYNEQKKFRAFQDFGKPIAGMAKRGATTAAAIAIPGGLAAKGAAKGAKAMLGASSVAKMGSGVGGIMSSVAKRKAIKNKPDQPQGAATDLLGEIASRLDSKALTIYRLQSKELEAQALDFHKYGADHFNYFYKYEATDESRNYLLPKKRFNYLKLSEFKIKPSHLNKDILNAYATQLEAGLTFWIWNYDVNIQNEIFDYKWANPDKDWTAPSA